MKRDIIITLFLAIATAVMAQPKEGTFSIIPRVGVAITSITKDEIYTTSGNTIIPMEKQWKTGMMAGVDFDYSAPTTASKAANIRTTTPKTFRRQAPTPA